MGQACAAGDESKGTAVEKVQPEEADSSSPQEAPAAAEDPSPKFSLTIVGARGIRQDDWLPFIGKPDCYCEVKTGDTVLFTTKFIANTCEPVWREQCEVREIEDGASLEFWIYDMDPDGKEFLGKAILESKDYAEKGFNGEIQLIEAKVDQACIKVKVKVADKDEVAGPPPEFTVTVEKEEKDKSFGLDLDTQGPEQLYVLEVKPGPFMDYNGQVGEELKVKRGDVIVSANGKTGSIDVLLGEFRKELKVECVVRRTVMTSILFDRGDTSEPLGLKVPEKPQGEHLLIKEITGGAAQKHNEACKEQGWPQAKLKPGDRIFSVGPLKTKGAKLLEALESKAGPVMLTLARAAKTEEKEEDKEEGADSGMLHWFFG